MAEKIPTFFKNFAKNGRYFMQKNILVFGVIIVLSLAVGCGDKETKSDVSTTQTSTELTIPAHVTAELAELRAENKRLEKDNEKLEKDNEKLKADLDKATTGGHDTGTKYAKLEAENKSLTAENKRLESDLDKANGKNESLGKWVAIGFVLAIIGFIVGIILGSSTLRKLRHTKKAVNGEGGTHEQEEK